MTSKNMAAPSDGPKHTPSVSLRSNSITADAREASVAANSALFAAVSANLPPADYIPAPMPMEPDHIENVRKLAAAGASLWCGYELTAPKPDGKRGKIPRSRNGSVRIGTNEPGDFYCLDDAIALSQAGKVHGIGMLTSGAAGIVGIDLDRCIDEDGELTGWAADIVERFDTYTEVSVSGRGLPLYAGKQAARVRRQGRNRWF